MDRPRPTLLFRAVAAHLRRLEAEPLQTEAWDELGRIATEGEPDLAAAIAARDGVALREIVAGWESHQRLLPEADRTLLKNALKAFRKSLKLTRLDAESKIGRGPMSKGADSGIVGITPPPHYPTEVWDELVSQGRLLRQRHGTYELPPE